MEIIVHLKRIAANLNWIARAVPLFFLVFTLSGCATSRPQADLRPFTFGTDTFAYANELVWEYEFTSDGKWMAKQRQPRPDYTHHCFVVARCAKQFFLHARFDATQPRATEPAYSKLVREVVRKNPRVTSDERDKVVIPGFANLREFSEANEALLKQTCGGAWRSYFQRGNWRMVFPFSRKHQAATAEALAERTKQNITPVIHIVQFPELSINHGALLFAADEKEETIEFLVYDPNKPERPVTMTFSRETRTFHFPRNDYFIGGPVNVYEVYKSLLN